MTKQRGRSTMPSKWPIHVLYKDLETATATVKHYTGKEKELQKFELTN